jgi:hypothetical protein
MKCYICGGNSIVRHGRKNTCEKHNRFLQMQRAAKSDKKYVPSIYEIEKLIPFDMKCGDCNREMFFTAADGQSQSCCAVLQHYRDGTLAITCMSCNTKHGQMVGDSYRDVPIGSKLCITCKTIKPLSMFCVRRDSKVEYPMSKCKQCNHAAAKQWQLNNPQKHAANIKKGNDLKKLNPEKYRELARKRYHKRKENECSEI